MVTKQFIKDLRKADTVVVRIDNKVARIILTKREVERNGWKKPEENVEYEFETWYSRYASFVTLFKNGAYQALENILKEGDELFFHAMDNRNNYLKLAEIKREAFEEETCWHTDYHGLHHDCLFVSIDRKGKTIVRDLMLEDSICPDNSARAIKEKEQ